jgi:hypothetical protein
MGAKIQAFDIFQTLLSSHYPLPLRYGYQKYGFGIQDQKGTRSRIRIRNNEKWKIRESVPDAVCNLVRGKPAHSQHTSTRYWHLKFSSRGI